MIYSKPIWFWALAGFWAVILFLGALGMVLGAITTPPPLSHQVEHRVLVFLPGAALIAVFVYGLPRSVKAIEIEGDKVIIHYLTGRKEELRVTRVEARLSESLAARQSPFENLHLLHSKGELVVYPFFFKDYRSLVKDLERIAGGIENKEILKL